MNFRRFFHPNIYVGVKSCSLDHHLYYKEWRRLIHVTEFHWMAEVNRVLESKKVFYPSICRCTKSCSLDQYCGTRNVEVLYMWQSFIEWMEVNAVLESKKVLIQVYVGVQSCSLDQHLWYREWRSLIRSNCFITEPSSYFRLITCKLT